MARELLYETATERFVLRAYEPPPLEPGHVRVRISLAAPKHGTEGHNWSGDVNRGRRWDPELRMFLDPLPDDQPPRPAVIRVGNMAVGVVEEAGTEVEGFRPGDHVHGYMPVCTLYQGPTTRLHHMPEGLSPEAAVCVDPAHVAFVAVRDGHVRLGDDVAVFGLGAIGLLTVQAARASGAIRVVAVDPLAARRERALAMGGTACCDPTEGDVALAIKEATGRRGVDVALETSGVDQALHEAIRCIRQCGTVVGVGWGSGTGAGLYLGEEFHVNRPTIVASQAASYWGNPDRDHPLWDEPRAQQACAELFARGIFRAERILDPIIDLEDAPEVLRAVRLNPSAVLKVGVRMGS
jgi:threonine dehydrogenase-like Zn-dependent dehydrogenase